MVRKIFATCGAISCQHGPIDWVGLHRHHHSFSDTEVDHHNSKKGFWWSHMGWMFKDVKALKAVPKLSADLIQDPYYRFLNKYFLFLQIPIGLSLLRNRTEIRSWWLGFGAMGNSIKACSRLSRDLASKFSYPLLG